MRGMTRTGGCHDRTFDRVESSSGVAAAGSVRARRDRTAGLRVCRPLRDSVPALHTLWVGEDDVPGSLVLIRCRPSQSQRQSAPRVGQPTRTGNTTVLAPEQEFTFTRTSTGEVLTFTVMQSQPGKEAICS